MNCLVFPKKGSNIGSTLEQGTTQWPKGRHDFACSVLFREVEGEAQTILSLALFIFGDISDIPDICWKKNATHPSDMTPPQLLV